MKNLARKIGVLICFVFCLNAFAGGGITHMFIAQESIAKIPDANLRNLLLNNLDAYLVGAYYPDSGYIGKATYGEISHWDGFINTFADYLNTNYEHPAEDNPRLTAFLFGCAAHRVSDEIIHWQFYHIVREKDFKGDGKKAHEYGDVGIDLLINIDKNRWLSQPNTWWVPVKDLLNIYKQMQVKATKTEIIFGNQVLRVAGPFERLLSPSAYPYLKWKMPWTAANYYTYPGSGILADEEATRKYFMQLWQRLTTKNLSQKFKSREALKTKNTLQPFAEKILEENIMQVNVTEESEGAFVFNEPIIINKFKLEKAIQSYLNTLR